MRRGAAALVTLLVAAPVWAQQLSLDIRDGRVTLDATNVPVRQVLAEWARVGGTKVVGAERITGAPLTLRLEGVPEAKALDIVLRGAAGYMAASRATPGTGRSAYDRILVLASSTPPAGGGPSAGGPVGMRAPNRFGAPPPPQSEQPDAPDVGVESQPSEPQPNPFANAFGQPGVPPNGNPFAQPGQNPFGQPVTNPFGQPVANPFGQPVANPFGQPGANPFGQPVPNPFGQPLAPTPASGSLFAPVAPTGGSFGTGSAIPGVVQPAPDANRPRPPGR